MIVRIAIAIAMLFGCCTCGAAGVPDRYETLTAQIRYGDETAVQQAIAELDHLSPTDCLAYLQSTGIALLLERHRYKDLTKLTQKLLLVVPYFTWAIDPLLEAQVRAKLGIGDTTGALQDAKRLYCTAPMGDMEGAMRLLATCLAAAHPDEPQVVEKFIDEQVTGADVPGLRCEVLDAIKIDPAPYIIKMPGVAENHVDGNTLLLAGCPAEAERFFRGQPATSPALKTRQTESIARAMKAQDGTIARANRFLRDAYMAELTKASGH